MRPFVVDGDVWVVIPVEPGDPRLVDGTGTLRIATTDPATRTVCVSRTVGPPLLDRVMIHEAMHALISSHGMVPDERAAQLVEGHGLEAVALASIALGRPVCVEGYCGQPRHHREGDKRA